MDLFVGALVPLLRTAAGRTGRNALLFDQDDLARAPACQVPGSRSAVHPASHNNDIGRANHRLKTPGPFPARSKVFSQLITLVQETAT